MSSSSAYQIVKINEDGTSFEMNEELLTRVFSQVSPPSMKVSLISVVGAFRTGKSFLLDLFLRYLVATENDENDDDGQNEKDWIHHQINRTTGDKLEGNLNLQNKASSESEQEKSSSGFGWRAGKERQTTGIWIWGKPFYRKDPTSGEMVAVFLLDTQGMFDSETSQMLTASIFGLSTLLSSYQIYNVDKRIQEDNLQHLALFTEYGRMALANNNQVVEDITENKANSMAYISPLSGSTEEGESKVLSMKKKDDVATIENKVTSSFRPFQHLEFLVRDWQNFDDEDNEKSMLEEMDAYLNDILSSRTQKDLSETREQINACFERLSCFLLPHPGFEVTKKTYDGSVDKIRPEFVNLITTYVHKVFTQGLAPKKIHGREVNATELITFIKVYVDLFTKADIFPEAKTLLEATAEANNVNAKHRAITKYKLEMNTLVGMDNAYVIENTVTDHHLVCFDAARCLFDSVATMGLRSHILAFREMMLEEIESEHVRYNAANAQKNPYKNTGFYLASALLVGMFYTLRVSQDLVCSDHQDAYDLPFYDCRHVSNNLRFIYSSILCFVCIMTIATGHVMYQRIQFGLDMLKNVIESAVKDYKKSNTIGQPTVTAAEKKKNQ